MSHGHLDHAGAIDNFKGTDVPIYLQKKELDLIEKEINDRFKLGDINTVDRLHGEEDKEEKMKRMQERELYKAFPMTFGEL